MVSDCLIDTGFFLRCWNVLDLRLMMYNFVNILKMIELYIFKA